MCKVVVNTIETDQLVYRTGKRALRRMKSRNVGMGSCYNHHSETNFLNCDFLA